MMLGFTSNKHAEIEKAIRPFTKYDEIVVKQSDTYTISIAFLLQGNVIFTMEACGNLTKGESLSIKGVNGFINFTLM